MILSYGGQRAFSLYKPKWGGPGMLTTWALVPVTVTTRCRNGATHRAFHLTLTSCQGVESGAGVPAWHVPEAFYGQAEGTPTTRPESRESEFREVA